MTSPAAPPCPLSPPLFPLLPPSLHLRSSASVSQMGILTWTRVIEGRQTRSFSPSPLSLFGPGHKTAKSKRRCLPSFFFSPLSEGKGPLSFRPERYGCARQGCALNN